MPSSAPLSTHELLGGHAVGAERGARELDQLGQLGRLAVEPDGLGAAAQRGGEVGQQRGIGVAVREVAHARRAAGMTAGRRRRAGARRSRVPRRGSETTTPRRRSSASAGLRRSRG